MKKLYSYLISLVAFTSILAAFYLADNIQSENHAQEQKSWTLSHLSNFRGRLEGDLNSRLHLVNGLAAMVSSYQSIDEERFQRYASALAEGNTGIRSLQLAPKAVIKHVFPHKGNEKAIGHDLLNDPKRREAALHSIENNTFSVAGPLTLLQGGVALIGRLPIYNGDPNLSRLDDFWGFATILLDAEPLYKSAGLTELPEGLILAIRGKDGKGADGITFFGSEDVFNQDPITVSVSLPSGSWQMAAIPTGGWSGDNWPGRTVFWLFGVFSTIITSIAVFLIIENQRQKALINRELEEKVAQRTESLSTALKDANAATEAKSRFLAVMSHELRTPLNGIIGMAHMLEETKLDNSQRDYIENLTVSSELLLTLVNEILDFTKIEANAIAPEKQSFSPASMIASLEKSANILVVNKVIEIKTYCDFSSNDFLLGDANKIMQVMNNLVTNAAKFTDKGEIEISVKTVSSGTNAHAVEFSVSDTGLGISDEQLKNLFLPFSQADASVSRKYGGTGLGLSISQGLVEIMGGKKIKVESQIGKGTCFSFAIQLQKGEAPSLETTNVKDHGGKTLSILLVEDNLINQKVAIALIEKMGHEVTLAENGLQAIEQVDQNSFDLILMDIHMPEMDGIEATTRIRNMDDLSKSDVTIIALTADALKENIEICKQAGMQDFLTKPIRAEAFKAMVSQFALRS